MPYASPSAADLPAADLPVLALHGFLGRGADWQPVGAAAARAGARAPHLLAPDLPGHGAAADAPPEAFSFEGALATLAAFLDRRRVPQAHLAGYSMGGRLALGFALRYPERVASLVLLGASAGLPTRDARAARRDLDAARAADLRRDFPAFLRAWYRMPLFASLGPARRDALVADRLAHGRPEALARALVGLGTGAQPWLGEQLRALRVPGVAAAGARDAKFVGLARALAAAGPFRVVVVPGAGHALLAEAPGAVAAILREAASREAILRAPAAR
ncbi:MAG: alpha/beta fold hydrolase [Rubricoccaceae bacterium]